ncbi:MAG TPA: 4-alpha-glucanotransferase [Candidatus Binataceae bacterium]|nr:4-alpha-glucanotransferase [Candidatus Binataceae bacterium]
MNPKRTAGILVPLFSMWSRGDLGRGEILDLAPMIDFALAMGHRAIQLLPLDETAPGEGSPYAAMSVFAIDPMYISMRERDGFSRAGLARARKAVAAAEHADARETIRREKLALLESLSKSQDDTAQFDAFVSANRYWLDDYALFRALKERYGWTPWATWPAEIARREPKAMESACRELCTQIETYCYWQFIADRQWSQMRAYGSVHGALLGGDLAFSPGSDSAEVWAHQDEFDLTRTVGAPPDAFNTNGQRWGLPLPKWRAMRENGFKFLRARVQRAAALYDFVRIDHVVGLYRTFNFSLEPDSPGDFTPVSEGEQLAQGEEIVRTILDRAGRTGIIAEDLGSVPPLVRDSLSSMGVPGYKVMQWERVNWDGPDETFVSPSAYPELALATTGTHDTETLVTWWNGQPLAEREKLLHALGVDARVSPHQTMDGAAREAVLEALYASPARLVLIPIQDLFGWSGQINRPGTVDDANWSWRLPAPLERLKRSRAIRAQIRTIREIAIRTGRFGR